MVDTKKSWAQGGIGDEPAIRTGVKMQYIFHFSYNLAMNVLAYHLNAG